MGRERELRLLKDALAGVEADHRSQLVSIIGEAGIGKTRLAEEFRNHIDGYSEDIYWHWGRSPSYGEGVSFWALGEMVRRRAGILEGEDAGRSLTRLRTVIAEFVPSEEDRQWIEPRLAGVAAFPQDLRAEHGYDNQADHLSLSPLLMEAFLTLGQSITQSKDFGPKYVGSWKTFFLPPGPQMNVKAEIRNRLEPFLTKAFRRPLAGDLLDRYCGYVYQQL